MDLVKKLHIYLDKELKLLNEVILQRFAGREKFIEMIGSYIVNSQGKKIRSILTILVAKSFENRNLQNIITTCAAVELIHMATLLHDDVIDNSKIRRSMPVSNILWGTEATILVGDFLISQAFEFLISTKSFDILEILSRASSLLIEGELAQLYKLKKKIFISEQEYYKIINFKTSELFSASVFSSAILSTDSQEQRELIKKFGLFFGQIFQITDDLLDYYGDPTSFGKSRGNDFKEGQVTLPIIFLFNKLENQDKKHLLDLLSLDIRTEIHFEWVVDKMNLFKIKDSMLQMLYKIEVEALQVLNTLSLKNQDIEYIMSLTKYMIKRTY